MYKCIAGGCFNLSVSRPVGQSTYWYVGSLVKLEGGGGILPTPKLSRLGNAVLTICVEVTLWFGLINASATARAISRQ